MIFIQRYEATLRGNPMRELLDMIARRAPVLMRTGGLIANSTENGSGHPLTKDEIAQMRRLVIDGKTANYIGRLMKRHPDCVRVHTRDLRVGKPRAIPEPSISVSQDTKFCV